MAILLFLIPISLLLLGVAVWAFVWSVRDGQFDDLDAAPLDILRDDPPAAPVRPEHAVQAHAQDQLLQQAPLQRMPATDDAQPRDAD